MLRAEPGLNALEVTLVHLHAIALAVVATLVTVEVERPVLHHSWPSAVDPVLSILAGTFLGFLVLGIRRAMRRAPRRRLSLASRLALVVAGAVFGHLGVILVIERARFLRWY